MKFIQARHSTRFKLIVRYDNVLATTHKHPITLTSTHSSRVNGIELFKNINCNRCLYSNHHKNAAKSLKHNSCEPYLCQSIVLLINVCAPSGHVYVLWLALNNFKNLSTIRRKTHHNAIVTPTKCNRMRLNFTTLPRSDDYTTNSIVTLRLSDIIRRRISKELTRFKFSNLVSSLTLLFTFFVYNSYLVVNFSVRILLVISVSYFNYRRAIVRATAAYKMCQCHTPTTAFIRNSISTFLLWY